MYILSDRAVKAIHEHRVAVAIQKRESARLRRLQRKLGPRRRKFRPVTSLRPIRVATSCEGSE